MGMKPKLIAWTKGQIIQPDFIKVKNYFFNFYFEAYIFNVYKRVHQNKDIETQKDAPNVWSNATFLRKLYLFLIGINFGRSFAV